MPSWEILYLWVLLRIEEASKVQSAVPTGTPSPIIRKARNAKVLVQSQGIARAQSLPLWRVTNLVKGLELAATLGSILFTLRSMRREKWAHNPWARHFVSAGVLIRSGILGSGSFGPKALAVSRSGRLVREIAR